MMETTKQKIEEQLNVNMENTHRLQTDLQLLENNQKGAVHNVEVKVKTIEESDIERKLEGLSSRVTELETVLSRIVAS